MRRLIALALGAASLAGLSAAAAPASAKPPDYWIISEAEKCGEAPVIVTAQQIGPSVRLFVAEGCKFRINPTWE